MKTKPLVLHLAAIFLGFAFTWVGIQHFTDTEWFEPIVPKFFENARFWVLVTGYEGPRESPTHFIVNDPDMGGQLRATREQLARMGAGSGNFYQVTQ